MPAPYKNHCAVEIRLFRHSTLHLQASERQFISFEQDYHASKRLLESANLSLSQVDCVFLDSTLKNCRAHFPAVLGNPSYMNNFTSYGLSPNTETGWMYQGNRSSGGLVVSRYCSSSSWRGFSNHFFRCL